MKKIILGLLVSVILAACGGQANAATSNDFVSGGIVYSVDNVRMITATPSQFVLQYNDGNSSEVFADTNGALLAKLLSFSPALKAMKQIGTSGVYINTDQVRKVQCQYGTGTPGQSAPTGDHMFLIWTPPGYLLAEDFNCVTFNAIKASAN